ncbi:hypothetical protein AB9M62_02745 [Bacillales bacterium AN1005]
MNICQAKWRCASDPAGGGGQALLSNKGEAAIAAVVNKLGGKVVAEGTVTDFVLENYWRL